MAAACAFGDRSADPTTTVPPSTTATSALPPPPINFGPCRQLPPPGPPVGWLPADLPLPPGSYPVQDTSTAPDLKQALFVIPTTLRDWLRFTNAEWHKTGWIQGRGEAEQGEIENTYVRGAEGGAYRVRTAYCDETRSELLLIYRK